MTAPAPAPLAAIPWTDAILSEFFYGDYTIISNAFAANDAGIALPNLRTYSLPPPGKPFGWQWEVKETTGNVQAYPEICYGRKPWSKNGTTDRLPIRVFEAGGVTVDIAYTMNADGSCNAAIDCWLLKDRNGGPESIAAEVMVWLAMQGDIRPAGGDASVCNPPLDATLYKRSLFDQGGAAWPIYTYLPNAATNVGVIQLGEYFQDLASRGLVSADWWLASIEFGNELIDGGGYCAVERFEVKV